MIHKIVRLALFAPAPQATYPAKTFNSFPPEPRKIRAIALLNRYNAVL